MSTQKPYTNTVLSRFFSEYTNEFYSDKTWTITKLIWSFFWFILLIVVFYQSYIPSLPSGICRFIDCNYLTATVIQVPIALLAFIACVLYIIERQMKTALFILSLISIIVFSYQDSSGVLYRISSASGIFIAQFIAYTLSGLFPEKFKLSKSRMHFSLQIVVAMYFMAFVSKIEQTGFLWFLQTEGLANEVLKNWLYEYVTTGEEYLFQKAYSLNELILNNQRVFSILLLGTLFLEGFCFTSLFSKKTALAFGIGLLFMHIGIMAFMDIFIASIAYPMLLYMLNVPAVYNSIVNLVRSKPPLPSETHAPQSS